MNISKHLTVKLKIMVLSARYPPFHEGGYELRCKNIMDELHKRGHQIFVLTSEQENESHYAGVESNPYPVYRGLSSRVRARSVIDKLTRNPNTHYFGLFLTFMRELALDFRDLGRVEHQIQSFQPDILYLGHITIFSRSLMPFLAETGVPLVYDEGGAGLIDCWRERGIWYKFVTMDFMRYPIVVTFQKFFRNLVNRLSANRLKLKWIWPQNLPVFFNSHLNMRNAIALGFPLPHAQVIHSGLDLNLFSFSLRQSINVPVVIFLPGRIEPRKGQLDGVHLLLALREHGINAKMIIVGQVGDKNYYQKLLLEKSSFQLDEQITILPMVGHKELVDFYHQADICFFPSYYRTGFSRIVLESMATGCIYISYGNEGSDEVIRHRQNGFLVRSQDFQAVTGFIKEMFLQPGIVRKITTAGRSDIEASFSMQKYIEKIERVIQTSMGHA